MIAITTSASGPALLPSPASPAGGEEGLAALFSLELLTALGEPGKAAMPTGKGLPDGGEELPDLAGEAAMGESAHEELPQTPPLAESALPTTAIAVGPEAPVPARTANTRIDLRTETIIPDRQLPLSDQPVEPHTPRAAPSSPATAQSAPAKPVVPAGDVQLVVARPGIPSNTTDRTSPPPASAAQAQLHVLPAAVAAPPVKVATAPAIRAALPEAEQDTPSLPVTSHAVMAYHSSRGAARPTLSPAGEPVEPIPARLSAQPTSAPASLAPLAAPPVAHIGIAASTAMPVPQPIADTISTSTPHDFANIVERLVQAREHAQPAAVRLSVANADFGAVNLRMEAFAAGLAVSITNADPDFASAARSALAERPVAALEGARLDPGSARSDQGSTGGSHSGLAGHGSQHGGQSQHNSHAAAPNRQANPDARQTASQSRESDHPHEPTSQPSRQRGFHV